jgi:hypothetical protein
MDILIDQSTSELSAYLDSQLNHVRPDDAIQMLIQQHQKGLVSLFQLPLQAPEERILDFVQAYISSAPKFLTAYHALAETGGITDYTQAFFDTATQFFFNKHPICDATSGTHALLCKAYLFHRILEELNDRVELERQWALAPVDIVQTNLIAHTLIGDEQANLLDQTVLIHLEIINTQRTDTTTNIFKQTTTQTLTRQLKEKGWKDAYARWPFLKNDLSEILYR